MCEGVHEGQRVELPLGRLGKARLAEPERGAPQAGQALDVLLAVVVPHVDALAAGDGTIKSLVSVARTRFVS